MHAICYASVCHLWVLCRQHKQASATGYSCAAAAATLLQDSVCTACHEARCRLRLYDHSRMQLLEAAALARLCSVQQQLQ